MEALALLLFILPGFYSLLAEIVYTKRIRRIGADYWVFLSLVCLLSASSIYMSDCLLRAFDSISSSLGENYYWLEQLITWVKTYLIAPLRLSANISTSTGNFEISLADYLFSFFIARKLIGMKSVNKHLDYVNGTEAIDKFLEELLLHKKNNTAMVTLDTGKVFIGPIVDGDVHKDIKNDSITIQPLMSGYKDNGKLVITTSNLVVSMKPDGEIELKPLYDDLKNNIQLSKVSYVSKFVLIAFAKYVSDKEIDFGPKNERIKAHFEYLHKFNEQLGISKDK